MRIRIIVVHALLAALAMAWCAPASASNEARPGAVDVGSQLSSVVKGRAAASGTAGALGCPLSHRYPLDVRAQTVDELPYVNQIDACTNYYGTQLWLRNRSSLVWRPYAGGARIDGVSALANLLASSVGYKYAVIVPGAEVTIYAPPSQVEWWFDIGMSAAWEGRDYLAGWAVSTGLAYGFNNRNTRVGSAVATCLFAVNSAVNLRQKLIANSSVAASNVVASVLSTGVGAGTCGQRLSAIANEQQVRLPSFLKDRSIWELSRLRAVDTMMARMQRAQNLAKLLLLLRS